MYQEFIPAVVGLVLGSLPFLAVWALILYIKRYYDDKNERLRGTL